MAGERASIFGGDEELDLSSFTPASRASRPKPEPAAIREAAESRGFRSREPAQDAAAAPAAPRQQRRYTTGRNRQLNLKVTEGALGRFYALAEAHGWVLGEAFEEAVSALERSLARKQG